MSPMIGVIHWGLLVLVTALDETWEGRGSEKARMIGRLAFRLWDEGGQVLCPGSTVRQTTLSVVE